jgi:hypothetical protein
MAPLVTLPALYAGSPFTREVYPSSGSVSPVVGFGTLIAWHLGYPMALLTTSFFIDVRVVSK